MNSRPLPVLNPILSKLSLTLDEACTTYEAANDIVEYCAPVLHNLLKKHPLDVQNLVQDLEWPQAHDTTYTRRRLLEAKNGQWSIYAICWLPGHYTPVHDHGTWGVVGVLQGCLYEHQMAYIEKNEEAQKYHLAPAGVTLLSEQAINTFVPEPDHIHRSGVPMNAEATASLHLYGRVMTHYHAYDLKQHTRSRLDVE